MSDNGQTHRAWPRFERLLSRPIPAAGESLPSEEHGVHGLTGLVPGTARGPTYRAWPRFRSRLSPPVRAGYEPVPSEGHGVSGLVALVPRTARGALAFAPSRYQPLSPSSTTTVYYKMSGMDASTTSRDTWVVTGTADFAAAHYAGSLATPLRDVIVAATWEV